MSSISQCFTTPEQSGRYSEQAEHSAGSGNNKKAYIKPFHLLSSIVCLVRQYTSSSKSTAEYSSSSYIIIILGVRFLLELSPPSGIRVTLTGSHRGISGFSDERGAQFFCQSSAVKAAV